MKKQKQNKKQNQKQNQNKDNLTSESLYTRNHKSIFIRNPLSQAVALACLGSLHTPAMAGTGSCATDGLNTISGAETTQCELLNGDSLNITGTGSIILAARRSGRKM